MDRGGTKKVGFRGESEDSQEVSVDWKGRPCRDDKHGGMAAAVFVLGISPSTSVWLSLLCVCVCVCCSNLFYMVFQA